MKRRAANILAYLAVATTLVVWLDLAGVGTYGAFAQREAAAASVAAG